MAEIYDDLALASHRRRSTHRKKDRIRLNADYCRRRRAACSVSLITVYVLSGEKESGWQLNHQRRSLRLLGTLTLVHFDRAYAFIRYSANSKKCASVNKMCWRSKTLVWKMPRISAFSEKTSFPKHCTSLKYTERAVKIHARMTEKLKKMLVKTSLTASVVQKRADSKVSPQHFRYYCHSTPLNVRLTA